MTKFQEEIKVAQKTVEMTSTDGPGDDSQQGPEHTDARSRADSSAVARFNVADLEPASLRENVGGEREKLHTTRIGSRRNGARRA